MTRKRANRKAGYGRGLPFGVFDLVYIAKSHRQNWHIPATKAVQVMDEMAEAIENEAKSNDPDVEFISRATELITWLDEKRLAK